MKEEELSTSSGGGGELSVMCNITCNARVVEELTDLGRVWLDVTQKRSKIATKIVSIANKVECSLFSLK